MKKTVITIIAAFLLSPLLMMAGNTASTVKTNPPAKEYTGYWVVTCGAERIVLSEAAIPEEALVRDANGELIRLNLDVLDKTLNFSKQSTFQGKQVTANQFVLVETDSKEKAGIKLNSWFGVCGPKDYQCMATVTCYDSGGTYVSIGWRAQNPCWSPANYNFCIAFNIRNPAIAGLYYIIACY